MSQVDAATRAFDKAYELTKSLVEVGLFYDNPDLGKVKGEVCEVLRQLDLLKEARAEWLQLTPSAPAAPAAPEPVPPAPKAGMRIEVVHPGDAED